MSDGITIISGGNAMYMKDKNSGDMVEILDINALINPNADTVVGRFHAGEEMQEKADFIKINLLFPSGESLPACWVDANYRQ
ncbi:acetyltransferase [Pseudomonadota bacterium]